MLPGGGADGPGLPCGRLGPSAYQAAIEDVPGAIGRERSAISSAAHVVADSSPQAPAADTEQRTPARRAALEEAARSHGIDPSLPTFVQFPVDPHSHFVRVQIVDQQTGDVVRQIPNEEVARFMEAWDAYIGALLDEQA